MHVNRLLWDELENSNARHVLLEGENQKELGIEKGTALGTQIVNSWSIYQVISFEIVWTPHF